MTTLDSGTRHAYPTSAMAGDYLRAAAGLVPSGVLLASVPLATVGGIVIGGFATIFAVFALRTALRHGTRLDADESGLRASGPLSRTIRWDALDRMKLAYYSTRRDRRAGWMQLELGAGDTRIKLDSRLDGFDDIVRRAATAAHERDLPLSGATIGNLEALGIRLSPFGAGR